MQEEVPPAHGLVPTECQNPAQETRLSQSVKWGLERALPLGTSLVLPHPLLRCHLDGGSFPSVAWWFPYCVHPCALPWASSRIYGLHSRSQGRAKGNSAVQGLSQRK